MRGLYSSPLRVYLLLGALAFLGVWNGLKLPVSLFPNSTKPEVGVSLSYGGGTAEQFLNQYGKYFEAQLRSISTPGVEVESLDADYGSQSVSYSVKFKWGVNPNDAIREVERIGNSFAARLPIESRDSFHVSRHSRNSGFLAISFFSKKRDLTSLYRLLDPVIAPKIAQVPDAANPVIFNPLAQEIRVELIPESVAAIQLFPREIEATIDAALDGSGGGVVKTEAGTLSIEVPRRVDSVETLKQIPFLTSTGKTVHLSDFARIDIGPRTDSQWSFRTNGAPTVILFATPKPGGNVKKMSEDIVKIIQEVMPSLPSDVEYRVLVDPSEFIRSAVNNVFHEVIVAAMLAVFVLFLFIGSVRNVVTAAIEIPLSMVLAFILMRMTGINLNLISLAGLALSAGMNVDGSVVVMENIFRHFEMHKGPLDFSKRLTITVDAVKEVCFPILASTVASLVVFLPLALTSDLANAILGDLALAVVFSHGFSAVVALILVPTVRMQLMAHSQDTHIHSPIEKQLLSLENIYSKALEKFIRHGRLTKITYGSLVVLLAFLVVVVLPRLPREIVGKPDTDWIVISSGMPTNTHIKQMEEHLQIAERDLLKKYSDDILYTFSQIGGPNHGTLMPRLKDKSKMAALLKEWEKLFENTPSIHYWVGPWNPSELPIPEMSDLKIAVRSNNDEKRKEVAAALSDLIQEKKYFKNVWTEPNTHENFYLKMTPHADQWAVIRASGVKFDLADISDMLRVASSGKRVGGLPVGNDIIDVRLCYPKDYMDDVQKVESFPISFGQKIVPLKALADIQKTSSPPSIFRQNEKTVYFVEARAQEAEKETAKEMAAKAREEILKYQKEHDKDWSESGTSILFEDPAADLNNAIKQLGFAVGLSVLLIFLTMTFQFGSFIEPLLVLISVPLGIIGVISSLYIFQSMLSLNAVLGVILLNGIAVANSIILVDFTKRLFTEKNLSPIEAAVKAARTRLRPILITSLTTVLGMLPIALGFGEGGKILQPLGISVSTGLWVSTLFTLFLVPALHVIYLEWLKSPKRTQTFIWKPSLRLPFKSRNLPQGETP